MMIFSSHSECEQMYLPNAVGVEHLKLADVNTSR